MIEELAKKDKKWRQVSLWICKDKNISDDIVQEMYLKLKDVKKELNDFYVILTIRSIFLDYCRKKKYNVEIKDHHYSTNESYEVDDDVKPILEVAKKLEFYELELLDMSGEFSFRQLEKRYKINRKTISKIVNESKKKIWQEKEDREYLKRIHKPLLSQ